MSLQPEALGLPKDIRGEVRFIAEDTAGVAFDEFQFDRQMRSIVLFNFMNIGESNNSLGCHDPEITERISAVQQSVGLRNTLIHGYQAIDYPTVWRAIHM